MPVNALRRLGGAALIGVGVVHLQQDIAAHYSEIPTIGTLFALNAAAAIPLGLALEAPVERLPGRAGRIAPALLAAAGIALAAATLAGLLVSEENGLFGFTEIGWRPAIVLAAALEVATVVLLGAALAAGRRPRLRRATDTGTPHTPRAAPAPPVPAGRAAPRPPG